MAAFVALLRAVNVGGTGKLPMEDLHALCERAGFTNVRTYIASGNVVFESSAKEPAIKAKLERALANYAGKPVGVIVRTGAEMAAVLAKNPFPSAAPNRTVAIFLDAAPPADALAEVRGRKNEQVAAGTREIYVHYGDGMADSKLVIPAAKEGTARNMNTVAKLAALSRVQSERLESKPLTIKAATERESSQNTSAMTNKTPDCLTEREVKSVRGITNQQTRNR